ncbi:hypothetical protein Q7P37_004678 [Cladosporium fusiforme]
MAAVVPEARRPSPNTAARENATLSVNLSSNNPFRNRAVSPGLSSSSPRSFDAADNRMSRNPFLDAGDFTAAAPPSKEVNGLTADVFGEMSLLDTPANEPAPSRLPPRVPPPRTAAPPVNPPRPSGSEQRRDRPRGPLPPMGSNGPSSRPPVQRPRGLSASSVMDSQEREGRRDRERGDRPPRTESEERRRRERRKEREDRHKREKEKIRGGGRSRKPQGLDIIDKLDVTGIYGQGLFHHDGPFDACNPHRNVKKDRRAPMEAFPANSANMALGGAGPLNSRIDLDRFHGRGEEAFDTFASTRKNTEPNIIDPTKRGEYVHGTESTGLGTSTFLDGAPASKRDLVRRESEEKAPNFGVGGGLQRKKSLAQRFRGMSNNRRAPEIRTPDARYHQSSASNENALEVSPPPTKAISAGGPARAQASYTNENEVNPFDQDYENAYARKGAQIRIAEQDRPSAGRNLSTSSAQGRGLTRSITADNARPSSNEAESKPSGGGFLSRMKSLKGGPYDIRSGHDRCGLQQRPKPIRCDVKGKARNGLHISSSPGKRASKLSSSPLKPAILPRATRLDPRARKKKKPNTFLPLMASHVPFLALRPDDQFSSEVKTRDFATEPATTTTAMDPTETPLPPPSRLPSWLRLPLVVVSSLTISAFAYSALADITGLELAAFSRDLADEWQVAAVVGWKVVSLILAFSSGYDWLDLTALTLLSNLPYYYLLNAFYSAHDYAVLPALATDLLSIALPFALFGRASATSTDAKLTKAASRAIVRDWQVLFLVTVFGAAIYAVTLYTSAFTWLPVYMVTHFENLRTIHHDGEENLLLQVLLSAPAGLATTRFLFVPAVAASNKLLRALDAVAAPPKFDPETASLSQTLAYNLGFGADGFSARTQVLTKRTAVLVISSFVNTFVRVLGTIEGTELTGALGWSGLWAAAGLLTGLAYGWVAEE